MRRRGGPLLNTTLILALATTLIALVRHVRLYRATREVLRRLIQERRRMACAGQREVPVAL